MTGSMARFTLIGGPTLLIEIGGLRILTDPTFDQPREYQLPGRTLTKLAAPALPLNDILPIDIVLLSHDHHVDNLDDAGRALLPSVSNVFTTVSGAERLGSGVTGLRPGERTGFEVRGRQVTVTATPARHGPPGTEHLVGDVIGFLLTVDGAAPIYVSGDTVLYDDLQAVKNSAPALGVLHLGRANSRGFVLTMDGSDAARLAADLGLTGVIPVHYEGWAHFSESAQSARAAFAESSYAGAVHWLAHGEPQDIALG